MVWILWYIYCSVAYNAEKLVSVRATRGHIGWRWFPVLKYTQSDANRSCKSTDTGRMCSVKCLFSSQLTPVPIILVDDRGNRLWETRLRFYVALINPGVKHASMKRQSDSVTYQLRQHTCITDFAIFCYTFWASERTIQFDSKHDVPWHLKILFT